MGGAASSRAGHGSGPATTHVTDGGTGVRFNFPGFARFRSITWDEWFKHFDRYGLVFVHEEDVADRAYSLWQAGAARLELTVTNANQSVDFAISDH